MLVKRAAVAVGAVISTVALAACGAGGAGRSSATGPAWHYVSRPDLTPPVVEVSPTSDATGDEESGSYVLLGPKNGAPLTGALMVDSTGQPVWIQPTDNDTANEKVQTYNGKPVLTYWTGDVESGHGSGDVVVLDSSYDQVATVTTGGDLAPGLADLHESQITSDGTMLLTAYVPRRADLTGIGGPRNGWVYDGVIQEVDIATGSVVFEWHSADHVPVADTVSHLAKGKGSQDDPFDYFHINSIHEDTDGSLLVSARNTSAVYDVDHDSGNVVWTLGGTDSDFTMGPGTTFAWQHDAERQADGTLTLYDDESQPAELDHSRGLRLSLDTGTMTATLVTQYLPPDGRRSASQGSVQVLSDGNVLIGWGSEPQYSLYTADGTLLSDADLGSGDDYRAYLAGWTGTPSQPPDLVLRTTGRTTTAYVSWNGATEVSSWRLLVGDDAAHLHTVTTAGRSGFETAIEVPAGSTQVQVQALDAAGNVLGTANSGI